jgi:uncharacterized protein YndB with AHSA1/START domain
MIMGPRIKIALGIGLTPIAALIGIPFIGGAMMPREHTATVTVNIAAPIGDVWNVVRDYEHLHEWAPDTNVMTRLPDHDGHEVWQQPTDDGTFTFTLIEAQEPDRLVVELVADPAMFGGKWTYELEITQLGTQITVTEEGWIGPPPFRFIMTVGDMLDDTALAYTAALKQRLEG